MSPLEVEIIKRKLAIIIENLKALEPIKNMKRNYYERNLYKRKATERLPKSVTQIRNEFA